MAFTRLVKDWCRHGAWTGDEGHKCDARIILIGEAGGKEEDLTGLPFMGQSGERLKDWWKQVGLQRNDIYITNVVRRRPNALNDIKLVSKEEIEAGIKSLHSRLAMLADPFVLVPTGNTSLNALLGHGRLDVSDGLKITDWRGSILSYSDDAGRHIKTIPTIHPADTFRQPILQKFCIADWGRIAKDSFFKELQLPERTYIIDPEPEQIGKFTAGVNYAWAMYDSLDHRFTGNLALIPPALVFDVENTMTKRGNQLLFKELTCVGFSYDPRFSMTISTLKRDYGSLEAHQAAIEAIRVLLTSPIPKVALNGLTDVFKVKHSLGIDVVNYKWDLMEMDHALDPNDGGDTEKGGEDASKEPGFKMEMRSLHILQSLYSRMPYHKDEGKSWDRVDQLRYNSKDCCEEMEVYCALYTKLKQAGRV